MQKRYWWFGIALFLFILIIFLLACPKTKCGDGICQKCEQRKNSCSADCMSFNDSSSGKINGSQSNTLDNFSNKNSSSSSSSSSSGGEGSPSSSGEGGSSDSSESEIQNDTISQNTTPSNVPSNYIKMYQELESHLSDFEGNLSIINESHNPIFATLLMTANSNRGRDLLKPNAIIGVNYELNRLKELGVEGVVVNLNFPLLYSPYHNNQSEQDAYLNFYKQVAQSVRAKGMVLIIENNFIFTQKGISTLNVQNFYNNLTLEQYLAARTQVAVAIAKELKPDYMTLIIEPDTEQLQTGKQVDNVEIQTQYLNMILNAINEEGITNVKLGAGVGTWHPKYAELINSFVNTDINYIDIHIYPINRDYLQRALAISDIAYSKGKAVTMTEAWLYKMEEEELGKISSTDIFARDAFSFWQPLDQQFLDVIKKLAYAKNLEFISPAWNKYFFAYLDYDQYKNYSSEQITALQTAEASKNIVSGNFTSTGLRYREIINN